MTKNQYRYYQCKICFQYKRAWVESECYKQELCPKCIDAVEEAVDIIAIGMEGEGKSCPE